MKGVLLAGGNGTRLRPLTLIANKHLLPVYNQPMIYYPLQTLKDMGCDEVIIVSGGENIGGFAELLGDGSDFSLSLKYLVQKEAGGVAQALQCAQGLVSGLFPVILGDNFFEETPTMPSQPTIYVKCVTEPQRFGVYDPQLRFIIEKPQRVTSNWAVTGLYIYDESVFEHIAQLKPSARNELEITDVNNFMLDNAASVTHYEHYWSDMGTFDSLNDVSNFVRKYHEQNR